MNRINISFHSKQSLPFNLDEIEVWIKRVIDREKRKTGIISYTFVDDEELLRINKDFLNHDYFTDIITFDEVVDNTINGDIFISLERIQDNSSDSASFKNEFLRVVIHGVLHLIGYDDHCSSEKLLMREKEDDYIELFHVKH
ncbi:MAG: rRNA maturation RNase YbeY [Salibacter sp.]|uniref:rRNA maturation RNase YbeY n=1 Tax=Salibacter sp. TaxID=2010995 RepID=UPI00286FEF59|nr:rRNA maturation RNase YbeY [Salibacter sp.]MDR9398583.1 rRNA maturation RNase YbeY [Salibacter sp.]